MAIPLYAYYSSIREFESLDNKEMKQRFGAFYQGKAIRRGKKVLVYPLIFITRRLVLIYLVVAGPEELIYQMIILVTSSFLSELMLYITEALGSVSRMHASTLHELVILQVAYCLLSFDFLDAEASFDAGYFPIAITGAYLVISLLFILFISLQTARFKLKILFTKRQYRRQRRDLQDRLERNHGARRERMHQLRQIEEEVSKNDDEEDDVYSLGGSSARSQ